MKKLLLSLVAIAAATSALAEKNVTIVNPANRPALVANIGTLANTASAKSGSSGNVTNAGATASLAAVSAKTNYITGFQCTASGATSALAVNVTVTGTASGTLTYPFTFPTGVTAQAAPLVVRFDPPLAASAINTAITVTLPAGGAGNTNAAVNVQGYDIGTTIPAATPTATPTPAGLNDGDPVTTWLDSSGNGHVGSQSGSARPTFKTSIAGGKPVVRFVSANSTILNISPVISSNQVATVIAVMRPTATGILAAMAGYPGRQITAPLANFPDNNLYGTDRVFYQFESWPVLWNGSFHVATAMLGNGNAGNYNLWVDGTSTSTGGGGAGSTNDWNAIGSTDSDGDLAEILFYNVLLSTTDRANLEKGLGTKYGVTVAGGTAVDPTTVVGLQGWWKADSLGP